MKAIKRIASFMLVMALVVTTFLATPITAEAAKAKKAAAPAAKVTIAAALIQGTDVVVSASGTAASDDGVYHLIAADVNQPANVGLDVAQAPVAAAATFTAPLNKAQANSLLFKKFTVCVSKGGVLTPVSNSMYITNPEACATHTVVRSDGGKKGILADASVFNIGTRQVAQMRAKQCTITLELSKVANGRGVPYNYHGKQFWFNTAYISAYDNFIARMNSQGAQVTLIIVADQGAPGTMISPYAANGLGLHSYYGLNATTTEGVETLSALASFLAARWSDKPWMGSTAKVDNWVIGNEVNAWNQWNYMANGGDLAVYTAEYANAFRLFYNGIKSENANANVYMCTDHHWALTEKTVHSAKSFITQFNNVIASQGNIDWRLAFHAYNYPLTNGIAWAPTANVQRSQNTKFVSVYNISVVTDFLSQPQFLSPTGAVRTVKLSEQGYTSTAGEPQQAASIVYAVLAANSNSHIDGIIISREKDAAIEMQQGLANGLMTLDNKKKMSWDFYVNAEDPGYIAQASGLAGADLTTLVELR